jgi:predicted AlkP superfamily phosphohydrolase/phosphomutase
MSKLIIIGIDGLDRKYVADHLSELPNFKRIIENSPAVSGVSVFPPDSDTAWSTIYTGLNPAKHGVVDFVDPLERNKVNRKESEYSYVEAFRGKTFWDILGRAGKRVCVIYPHMAFPIWGLNGFMINPDPADNTFHIYPPDYQFSFDIGKFHSMKRIPRTKNELKEFLAKKREAVKKEFELTEQMMAAEAWDMLFMYSSALDTSMHIFWNYCDTEDPTYPGPNQFDRAIIDFHRLYDDLLGSLLSAAPADASILIISDHGHARRPVKLVNVNEILRRSGFLSAKEGKNAGMLTMFERLKRLAVDLAQKSGMRPAAQTILRMFPRIKKMYTKPMNIDFSKTLAHCTDLSGMKAYSYGGVKVYREKFATQQDFETAMQTIIDTLSNVTLPNSETKVFEWVKRREEVYTGRHLEKYPEILFNLQEDYGAGWTVKGGLWDTSQAHKFFPGSHRASTPVFYWYKSPMKTVREEMVLEDICPSVLRFFDVPSDQAECDGRSII